MLTYYKFKVPHPTNQVTLGMWAVTEDDARASLAKVEKCHEASLELIRTETEVTIRNIEQPELI